MTSGHCPTYLANRTDREVVVDVVRHSCSGRHVAERTGFVLRAGERVYVFGARFDDDAEPGRDQWYVEFTCEGRAYRPRDNFHCDLSVEDDGTDVELAFTWDRFSASHVSVSCDTKIRERR
ncbi:hypothetical protein ABT256_34485 [Amycolatopsis japonica]|uniref:hypothetical protein n=1 Tax=Amycolatopsis japonica TaxID=208439 RepID=UPI00332021E0